MNLLYISSGAYFSWCAIWFQASAHFLGYTCVSVKQSLIGLAGAPFDFWWRSTPRNAIILRSQGAAACPSRLAHEVTNLITFEGAALPFLTRGA